MQYKSMKHRAFGPRASAFGLSRPFRAFSGLSRSFRAFSRLSRAFSAFSAFSGPGLFPRRPRLGTFRARAYFWASIYSKAKILTILLFSLIHRRSLIPSVKQVWRSSSQGVKKVWRHVRFFNDSAEPQRSKI